MEHLKRITVLKLINIIYFFIIVTSLVTYLFYSEYPNKLSDKLITTLLLSILIVDSCVKIKKLINSKKKYMRINDREKYAEEVKQIQDKKSLLNYKKNKRSFTIMIFVQLFAIFLGIISILGHIYTGYSNTYLIFFIIMILCEISLMTYYLFADRFQLKNNLNIL